MRRLCETPVILRTAIQLVREFNVRFAGRSITVHAARKWLVGEAIPTQEKLRALSQWLATSAEWLRYGDQQAGSPEARGEPASRFDSGDLRLLTDLQSLNEQDRQLAREFIRTLVRLRRHT